MAPIDDSDSLYKRDGLTSKVCTNLNAPNRTVVQGTRYRKRTTSTAKAHKDDSSGDAAPGTNPKTEDLRVSYFLAWIIVFLLLLLIARLALAAIKTAPPDLARQRKVFGIQSWVALPRQHEETAPAFDHVEAHKLPVIEERGLAEFIGVERRFQVRGVEGGVTVVDDYGHHPTEIRATLGMSGRTIRTVDDVRAAPTPQGQPVEVIAIRRGETRKFTLVPAARPTGLASHEFMLAVFAGVLVEKLPGWNWIDIPGAQAKAYLSHPLGGGREARIDLDRMSPGWTNQRAVIEAALRAKQAIAQRFPQAVFVDGPAYVQEPTTPDLPGAQFEAEYADGGNSMRGWYVVLSDGYGGAVTWSYVAPEDGFEAAFREARRLLRSLLIFPRPVAGGVR